VPSPELKERNAIIVEARRTGTHSLDQLADHFKISKERIRQISEAGGVSNEEAAKAYKRSKVGRAFDYANEHATAILMRYIAGEDVSDTAAALGVSASAVQAVLDEQLTDEVIAARSNTRMARMHPHRDAGPRDKSQPREDRYWTEERCWASLVGLAMNSGGRLPSSTQYQKLAPKRDDLPSFATVRNRLGRWSSVRAEVHRRLKR
jgi:hypothetical protein